MSTLDKSDVEKIAHLARLGVEQDDMPEFAGNLSDILTFVEQMAAVDTDGIEPMSNPHDMVQRLREDAATEENQREQFQAIAPETENGLYLVPKVIE